MRRNVDNDNDGETKRRQNFFLTFFLKLVHTESLSLLYKNSYN